MLDLHVVVMTEAATPIENLSRIQTINEVFGPFASDHEADEFVAEMVEKIPNRSWLITPLSCPKQLRGKCND